MLRLSLELLSVVLEPPPGRPLIYTGDTRRFTESQHRSIFVFRVGLSLFLTYNISLYTNTGLQLQVLNRLRALSPHLCSWALALLNY